MSSSSSSASATGARIPPLVQPLASPRREDASLFLISQAPKRDLALLATHIHARVQPLELGPLQVNAAFMQRLTQELTQALSSHVLAPLIQIINEYAKYSLTTPPSCHVLTRHNRTDFTGFNVSRTREGGNVLLLTTANRSKAPSHAQLLKVKEEGTTLLSRTWEVLPVDESMPAQAVPMGEGRFFFHNDRLAPLLAQEWADGSLALSPCSDKIRPTATLSFYDPGIDRIWRKPYALNEWVTLTSDEREKEKRCWSPSFSLTSPESNIVFGDIVSPSKIVSVHCDALRLFSTTTVDFHGYCEQLCEDPTNVPFTTALSIPRSDRFIAARSDTTILSFHVNHELNRFVIKNHFSLREHKMSRKDPHILNLAANASAVAIVDTTQAPRVQSSQIPPIGDPLSERFVSLWDHERSQRISYFAFTLLSPVEWSWLTENGVLILAHARDNVPSTSIDVLSLIDFREPGTKKVVR